MADETSVQAAEAAMMDEDRELGTAPIKSLFPKYTFTTLVGMGAQAIMVILEGIFIGNGLGDHGLGVVGIIMPLEYINLAIGAALTMGVATAVGNRLGEGDVAGAKRAFNVGFWLTTILNVILAIIFFLGAERLALLFGATPDLLEDSTAVLRIFAVWFPFLEIGQMLCGMLRVDEKPGLSSAIMTVSAIVAAAWLWFGIFVLGKGNMAMGNYYGASIGLWAIAIFWFVGNRGTFNIGSPEFDGSLIAEIIKIGLPSFCVQVVSTIYATVVNNELGIFGGDQASLQIAAFALLSGYVTYIVNMMWQCAQYAVQPIASYNYGAKSWGRLKELLKTMTIDTIILVAVVSAIFIVFARPVMSVFAGGSEELVELGTANTLPMIILGCVGCLPSLLSTYYQSVEKIVPSVIMGVLRYLVLAIPAMLIMTKALGVNGVWWSMPVVDGLAGAIAIIFIVREMRELSQKEA